MKKLLFSFLIVLSFMCFDLQAQESIDATQGLSPRMERIATELKLDSKQQSSLLEIQGRYLAQEESLRLDKEMDRLVKRQKRVDLQKAKQKEISAILSEDQLERFEKMHAHKTKGRDYERRKRSKANQW